MKGKRIVALVTVCTLALSNMYGCSGQQTKPVGESQTGSLNETEKTTVAQETETQGETAGDHADTVESQTSYIEPVYNETKYGWLLGYKQDSTYIYKGIQYGVVQNRFHPASEPESWTGVKSALTYGETCPNTSQTVSISSFVDNADSDMVQNEQCLFLNVWTQSQETTAKKPVIFFIHGGGYSTGASNELACYDGKNISEYGDVVFVNMNHRLNYLGYTDLSSYGDEYAMSGDVGMQDLVMALKWVQNNIENFGGDPSNVTIVGQSGGANKVGMLMQIPEASDLFSKAMMCSGTGMALGMMSAATKFGTDVQTAQQAGVALVENCKQTYGLDSDEEALEKLETISYEELALLAKDTGAGNNPTVGNDYIPQVYDAETRTWPKIAKDKTLIISNTFGELAGNDGVLVMPMLINMMGAGFDPQNPDAFLKDYYKPTLSEDDMKALVEQAYGTYADQIIEEFSRAYPSRDIIDVLSVNKARQYSTDLCIDKAKQDGADVFNCVFAYEYPIMGGIMNYHTGGDLPFLFYNLDTRDYMIQGDEKTAYRVADEAATALINYAYTGNPGSDSLAWTPFTVENGETMIFDDTSELLNYPDQELLKLINTAMAEKAEPAK